MIVTKAYITEIPTDGDNKFKVDVPLMNDNVTDTAIFNAYLCSDPANYNGYEVGDCVYVTFEDDVYDVAIILGKFYVDVPDKTNSFGIYNHLKITNKIELPNNTKIGDYSADDIFGLTQDSFKVDKLREDVDDVLSKIPYFVKWPVEDSEGAHADTIKCMTGEDWDNLSEKKNNFLYFLTTVPPSETK